MSQAINLNETIGVLPPEARGCETSLQTMQELSVSGNSNIFDPSMDKSRCFQKQQIYHLQGDKKVYPYANSVTTPGVATPGTDAVADAGPTAGRPHGKARSTEKMPLFEKLQSFLPEGSQEKNMFWIGAGLLALFIILKLKRK